ncbi:hypothetical protein [Streptomyces jumonjinensis]|uniref:Uncharacterized protein n=1 Tax=Streptomyces jumonjinensis TaxID=1945 RepID=A0A646KLD7_STRJU|nr:hypothetical protein [Streptomyces jumonjinensis]MQT03129.1 hypothetical protein [Streptomyces jumonjinensis]
MSDDRLRVTLATLAERWREIADSTESLAITTANRVLSEARYERARHIRRAADDIDTVLRTGRVPHDLMTTTELAQNGPAR